MLFLNCIYNLSQSYETHHRICSPKSVEDAAVQYAADGVILPGPIAAIPV
jgi:hypothetical protein